MLLTLSLCRKARKLSVGFDPVAESMEQKKTKLVLTAVDLSQKSRKEVLFLGEKYHIPVLEIPYTMQEIARYVGKEAGILGIEDSGLSGSVSRTVGTVHEEE